MQPRVGDPVGYCDVWSAAPGETIRFMVSTSSTSYRAELVRLLGPTRHTTVVSPIDGDYSGQHQVARPGSCVVIPDATAATSLASVSVCLWAWPTRPATGREQVLAGTDAWALVLDSAGVARFRVETPDGRAESVGSRPVTQRTWLFLCGSYDARGTVTLYSHERGLFAAAPEAATSHAPAAGLAGATPAVYFATGGPAEPGSTSWGVAHFDGKLEAPTIYARALSIAELADLTATDGTSWPTDGLVGAWRFQHHTHTAQVTDTGPHDMTGYTVNAPTRAMTGHGWRASVHDPHAAPDEYGAIHFHADDLADAGWAEDFVLRVPDDASSGVYAARLSTPAGGSDLVPFVVRPPRGGHSTDIALLLPTFTYLAYANELLPDADSYQSYRFSQPPTPSAWDAWLAAHPELGLSLYDSHADGSGVCYSSRLRPIPSLRPDFVTSLLGFPRHLAADLITVDWLAMAGYHVDVLTDEDLDAEGAELLSGYRVILTGSHPEYVSEAMLDGLESYLRAGGRLMYLGGNGFCWVTSLERPEDRLIEVRRGQTNQLPWDSAPGELHHSTTGELGGQWDLRGRPTRGLTGVGTTAMGLTAKPYVRASASHHPRYAWIFAGLPDDEVVGGDGPVLGNAAGYEIDRADTALGSPAATVVLASAVGDDADYELMTGGSVFTGKPPPGEPPFARADMSYLETATGGAVFSVGSISWTACLATDGANNPVATVTRNVLTAFLADELPTRQGRAVG